MRVPFFVALAHGRSQLPGAWTLPARRRTFAQGTRCHDGLMVELTAWSWVILAAGAVVVGLSKAALPGGGTLAVALFAAVLPARNSTGTLLVLLIVGDVFAILAYRRSADWALLRRLVPTVLVGIVLGSVFLAATGDAVVRRVIAVILLALIAVTLVRRYGPTRGGAAVGDQVSPGRQRLEATAYGALGGFTTMVANAGGPVMSMYFLAMRLGVWAFLGTSAWFFFAVNLVKVPFSVGLGLITAESLVIDAVLAPLVIVGAFAGRKVASHMDQKLFERLVIALTLVSALNLLR